MCRPQLRGIPNALVGVRRRHPDVREHHVRSRAVDQLAERIQVLRDADGLTAASARGRAGSPPGRGGCLRRRRCAASWAYAGDPTWRHYGSQGLGSREAPVRPAWHEVLGCQRTVDDLRSRSALWCLPPPALHRERSGHPRFRGAFRRAMIDAGGEARVRGRTPESRVSKGVGTWQRSPPRSHPRGLNSREPGRPPRARRRRPGAPSTSSPRRSASRSRGRTRSSAPPW